MNDWNSEFYKKYALPVITGFVGTTLVLIDTSLYGAGLSPDSVGYISVARNLLSGKGLSTYAGGYLINWPPLFPVMLASAGMFGLDPLDMARYLNAFSFGVIIVVCGFWLYRNVKDRYIVFFGLVLLLVSVPLLLVSTYAWSEPVFILLTLLSLISLEKYLNDGKTLTLLYAGCLAALACLTRYIGVTVILTGLVLISIRSGSQPLKRLAGATIYCIVSALPLAGWVARNYYLSSTFTGVRAPSHFTLLQSLGLASSTVSSWFMPWTAQVNYKNFIVGSALLLLSIIFVTNALYLYRHKSGDANPARLTPYVLFLVIYVGYLLSSSVSVAFDKIDSRLLSPVFAPIVLLGSFSVYNYKLRLGNFSVNRFLYLLFISLFFFCLYCQIIFCVETAKRQIKVGAGGYATIEWKESRLATYLNKDFLKDTVYSNAPEAVYILSGMSAVLSPSKYIYNSPGTPTRDIENLVRDAGSKNGVYLVWFNNTSREYIYDIAELQARFNMEPVADTKDGSVYFVKKAIY